MKITLPKALILSLSLIAGFAHAQTEPGPEVDPCSRVSGIKDDWILSANRNNESTKESLVATFKLLATRGFRTTLFNARPLTFLVTYVEPSLAGADQIQNLARKLKVLSDLQALPGNKLDCNHIDQPGMGGGTSGVSN